MVLPFEPLWITLMKSNILWTCPRDLSQQAASTVPRSNGKAEVNTAILIVESMLSKVMEEFQHRLASQTELVKAPTKDSPGPDSDFVSLSEPGSGDMKYEERAATQIKKDDCCNQTYDHQEGSKGQFMKHKMLFEQQKKNIQELKHTLYDTKAGMKFLQRKCQEEFNNLGTHLHGLAHAASGYQKVLDGNRKLYNLVQDLKGNIRVYCRVRPPSPGQTNSSNTYHHIDD